MHNSLIIKVSLSLLLLLGVLGLHAQLPHADRYLSNEHRTVEQLDLSVTESLAPQEDNALDAARLISELRVLYPEWRTSMSKYDRALLQDQRVNERLVDISKLESQYDLLPYGKDIITYAQEIGVSKENLKKLNFYRGYDLFKQQKYKKSLRALSAVSKKNSEEYKYAQYYSALANIMLGEYKSSLTHLKRIGKHKVLSKHTPYYQAVGWYALDDHNQIHRKLATRQLATDGYQTDAIRQIIGYSAYKIGNFDVCMTQLSAIESRTTTDALLIGIISNDKGRFAQAAQHLNSLSSENSNEQNRITFERAYAAAGLQDWDAAIAGFNQLINANYGNTDLLQWNIACSYAHQGNATMAIRAMQNVNTEPLRSSAQRWIAQSISAIKDTKTLAEVSQSLDKSKRNSIAQQLYQNATNALNSNDRGAYREALNALMASNPSSPLLTELYAIDGVMQIEKGNHRDGITSLQQYNKNSHQIDHTEIAPIAQYYIGYDYLYRKNTTRSIGHFSKALTLLKRHTSQNSKALREDILTRIADIQMVQKSYKEALASYHKAEKLSGKQNEYQLYQIATLNQLLNGEYEQIMALDDLLTQYPSGSYSAQARYDRANAYFSVGKFDKARQDYEYITRSKSSNEYKESALLQLGLINVNAGDYATARDYYTQVINSSSNTQNKTVATNALKEIYADHDVDTEAYLSLTDDNTPKDQVLYELAISNGHDGKIDLAIEQLQKLLNDYPDSDYVLAATKQLGIHHAGQKSWVQASKYLKKYLKQKEDKDVAQKLIDIVYSELADMNEYIAISKESWYVSSEQNDIRLGHSLLSTGQIAQAEKTWSKYKNNASKDYAQLTAAIVDDYIGQRNWNKVIDINKRTTSIRTPKMIYSHALALMNIDKYDDGIQLILSAQEALIKDSAWLVKSVILLSDMYYMQGDKASAIGALEGMLASDITIPPSLKKQATERLNSFNL